MPSSLTASVGTGGTIVLVEDYDALSVAFGSTLRKLAPSHHTVVVRSLAEAERAAAASRPDLFVIDFDPPHTGAVGFFNRMKAAYPAARVLVIGPSTWLELTQERIRMGAFQFIAKPFELEKFGAAVQALLPSEKASAAPPAGGTLRDLDLTDLIALFGISAVTTILRVTATGGATGEIYFFAGQMTQAVVMGKAGILALEEMLRWPSPRFVENEMRTDPSRTIHGPWTSALFEALRAARTTAAPPEHGDDLPAAAAPTGNTIVVVDDTELLLVFVEDSLRTARPSLEIATATSGTEGLKRTVEILPDLVLLDYSLPDVAGDEVCRLLLEDARTSHIPVIMMSGHVAEMAATAERFPNVVGTIEKPFLSAALVHLVEGTLADLPEVPATPARQTEPPPRPPGKKVRKAPKAPKPKAKTSPAASRPAKPGAAPVQTPSAPALTIKNPEESPNGASSLPEPGNPPPAPEPEIPAPDEPPSNTVTESASPPIAPPTSDEVAPRREAQIGSGEAPHEAAVISVPAAPARIRSVKSSTVVLTLPLEITSIQFAPSLETRAIRAKPFSSIVSVHILPGAGSRARVAAMAFEFDHVDLDARGQLSTVRLRPSAQPWAAPEPGSSEIIAEAAAFPGDGTMEVTPNAGTPTRVQLLALFEVVAVELTATFGVEQLILKTRGAKVRLQLRAENASTGITFQSAQVLLDRSARIAQVLLDAPD